MKKVFLFMTVVLLVGLVQAQDLKPKKDKATKKYGYMNKSKEWVIEPQFEKVKKFKDGFAQVTMSKKTGLINETGKYIVEPKYDKIESFNDNFANVELNKKTGLINKEGEEIVAPKYDKIGKFKDDIAIVILAKKEGFINIEGVELLKPSFDKINAFRNGLSIIENKAKKGLVKIDGTIIFEPEYDMFEISGNDIYASKAGKWGVLNTNGKVVFEPQFMLKPVFNLNGGYAIVKVKGKIKTYEIEKLGVISRDGTFKLDCNYLRLDIENGQYFTLSLETNKWIIYDENFTVVKSGIEGLQKCKGKYFNNGICAAEKDDKWGFINKSFETVIPYEFDKIDYDGFQNGFCAVKVGDLWGFIKIDGSFKFEPKYTEVDAGFKNIGGTKTAMVWEGKKKYALYADGTKKLLEDRTPPPATTTSTASGTATTSTNTTTTTSTAQKDDKTWILGKWNVYEEKVGVVRKGTKCHTRHFNFTTSTSVTLNEYSTHTLKYSDDKKRYSLKGSTLNIGDLKYTITNLSSDKKSMTLRGLLGTYYKIKK